MTVYRVKRRKLKCNYKQQTRTVITPSLVREREKTQKSINIKIYSESPRGRKQQWQRQFDHSKRLSQTDVETLLLKAAMVEYCVE